MISQEYINQLLDHSDLSLIVRNRINLKRKGNEWQGLCPFHQEKTPSFTVVPHKKIFYCFGCHAGGNAIKFIRTYHQYNFIESVKLIAQETNYPLPELDTEKQSFYQDKKKIHELLSITNNYFHKQLIKNTELLTYLKNRMVNMSSVKSFGLGYAPTKDKQLLNTLKKSYTNQEISDSGLEQKKGGNLLFYNRLTFPIHNEIGEIIAFGARSLSDQQPKYINSPQTRFYHKKKHLYGLYQALKSTRQLKSLFVVEGYMDVILLSQHGITNVVATLGTAVTESHLKKLIYYTNTLIFCFDGDNAGRRAAWKTTETLLPLMHQGINTHFIFLPQGHDPDSIVREHGKSFFVNAFKQSMSLESFFFQHLSQKHLGTSIASKTIFASTCQEYINDLPNGIFKSLLTAQLVKILDLDENDLNKQDDIKIKTTTKPIKNTTAIPQVKRLYSLIVQNPHLAHLRPKPPESILTSMESNYPTLSKILLLIDQKKIQSLPSLLSLCEEEQLHSLICHYGIISTNFSENVIKKELDGLLIQLYILLFESKIMSILDKNSTEDLSDDLKKKLVILMQEKKNFIAMRTPLD
jgi:DNA primase